MMTTFTDVMDSHCTVQRNPKINSMTGNRFETSAEGEIPKPEIYESHKALVDAADNQADAGTTRSSAGEGLQSSYGVGILNFKLLICITNVYRNFKKQKICLTVTFIARCKALKIHNTIAFRLANFYNINEAASHCKYFYESTKQRPSSLVVFFVQ